MDAAWGQVGDIIEANRRIRRRTGCEGSLAHLAQPVPGHGMASSPERGLALMAPVQRRVVANGLTLHGAFTRSTVPRAALSAPLRRALRPRDHVAAALGFATPQGPERLLERINGGEVSAAPPRVTPTDLPTVDAVAGELGPTVLPPQLADWFRRNPWREVADPARAIARRTAGRHRPSRIVVAAVAVLAAAIAIERCIARAAKAGGGGRSRAPGRLLAGSRRRAAVLPQLHRLPIRTAPRPSRRRAPPRTARKPRVSSWPQRHLPAGRRQPDRGAAAGAPAGRSRSARRRARSPRSIRKRRCPAFTLGRHRPSRPAWSSLNGEVFREAWRIRSSTSRCTSRCSSISAEHFLPNINKIPPNTITLLETNQRFIEAYMVGPEPRIRARAPVARVPDRPARQLLPPVLGLRAR